MEQEVVKAGLDWSTVLNLFFGVALTMWSWQLRTLNTNVKELAMKFEELTKRLDALATRVTVIEVKQGYHSSHHPSSLGEERRAP